MGLRIKNPKDTILCLWDYKIYYMHKIAAPNDTTTNTTFLSAVLRGNRMLYEIIFNTLIHFSHYQLPPFLFYYILYIIRL